VVKASGLQKPKLEKEGEIRKAVYRPKRETAPRGGRGQGPESIQREKVFFSTWKGDGKGGQPKADQKNSKGQDRAKGLGRKRDSRGRGRTRTGLADLRGKSRTVSVVSKTEMGKN